MKPPKIIIFIHGWGCSSGIFQPFYHHFKNDFLAYFIDLPGFGNSPIEKPMTLKDYADFVCKFIKNHNIENPVIVGHSFGGAVAAKLAILYPNILSKLILVSASAVRQPRHVLILIKKFADLLKPFISLRMRRIILKILRLDKTDYAQIENENLKETFKIAIKENLAPKLGKIKIPTLVIWGEKDAVTPLKEGRVIAENIPEAKLAIIEGAGHFVFWDEPAKFIKLVKEFSCQ